MSVPAALPPSGRTAHLAVLGLTVAVFAAVLGFVTWQTRAGLREEIFRREADKLETVASLLLANEAKMLEGLELADVPGKLLDVVLRASEKMSGVIAVRIFDADGHFKSAVPLPWSAEPAPAADWADLLAGRAVARTHPPAMIEEILLRPAKPEEADVPLAEVWAPLREGATKPLAGAAQFWIAGDEFAALDRRLFTQAVVAWLAGSLVIGLALSWAFRRLATANEELSARSEDLLRANRELVLAAKTTALGTVTAHLIHELKNPIAGLEEYVASQAELGPGTARGDEVAAATELTRRLRTMVNDVVGVLRDEHSGAHFELTAAETIEIATGKVRGDAAAQGVKLELAGANDATLRGRRANLASLVLRNLIQNAVEATPRDGIVRVTARTTGDGAVEFSVEDGGAGLPAHVREKLFQPVASTKRGGSGLGLALSQQLAQQAGGRLELVRSDLRGTCFRLVLLAEA